MCIRDRSTWGNLKKSRDPEIHTQQRETHTTSQISTKLEASRPLLYIYTDTKPTLSASVELVVDSSSPLDYSSQDLRRELAEYLSPVKPHSDSIASTADNSSTTSQDSDTDSSSDNNNNNSSKKPTGNYCLWVYLVIMIILAVFCMAFDPARDLLMGLMYKFQGKTIVGLLILTIIGGSLILTPIPFFLFEVLLGFIFKDFLLGFGLCIVAKWFGCAFAFFTNRYCFKSQFQNTYKRNKMFKIIGRMINDNEAWFLFLIGIIVIPTFITNASLAILDVKFLSYVVFYLTPTCLKTSFGVWLGVKCVSIMEVFDNSDVSEQIYIGVTLLVSIAILVFVSIYTKRVIKKYEREEDTEEITPGKNDSGKAKNEEDANREVSPKETDKRKESVCGIDMMEYEKAPQFVLLQDSSPISLILFSSKH
eukprot:TRINITY_DN31138_c0_g1_i1.p1 TRINITY_DN31138_c0_g1~~TRINITY_DN31138_c0_g1_i1.p1  ORF type:complete len:421 (+),score=87.34 TRINITY_DN31138_c0_g1_i1:64-1326(+)